MLVVVVSELVSATVEVGDEPNVVAPISNEDTEELLVVKDTADILLFLRLIINLLLIIS